MGGPLSVRPARHAIGGRWFLCSCVPIPWKIYLPLQGLARIPDLRFYAETLNFGLPIISKSLVIDETGGGAAPAMQMPKENTIVEMFL